MKTAIAFEQTSAPRVPRLLRQLDWRQREDEHAEVSAMRILIVVHGYPPTHTGGAEQRAARTARGLHQRGCDVRVLCVESIAVAHDDLRWEDCVQDSIPVRRLFFRRGDEDVAFRESYDNPHARAALTALFSEWQPDVVYLFSGYLMSASVVRAAKAHRIPLVIALTDYWWLCHRINLLRSDATRCAGPEPLACARCHAETYRRFRMPAQTLPASTNLFWKLAEVLPPLGNLLGAKEQMRRADFLLAMLRQADALISPSRYLADVYIQHGVDPARVHVWRQGVDLDACPLRTPAETLRIGFIGQMKPHKGAHLLLDAWGQLNGSRARSLTLYGSDLGDDSYGRTLQRQIDRLEHVRWEGHFVGAQVWAVLAQLDAIVVPSRWVENSPNIILEAQAVGVPVVGTDLGGIAELVQHDVNGLRFAPDDSADLARQLQRLLDEPLLLHRLQRAATPFRTNEEQLEEVVGLFNRLVPRCVS